MKELTIEIEVLLRKDLKEYLMSLDGVLDVNVLFNEEKIYIKYDESKINDYIIKREIHLFFGEKFPSILSFDKHSSEKTDKYSTVIEDACCDNCFLIFVDNLYDINGIVSFNSNFDVCGNFRNIEIEIEYIDNYISLKNIKKIVNDYFSEY